MKVFMKAKRNGSESLSMHEGMDVETVLRLLNDLGATDIQQISEKEYLDFQTANPKVR